MWKKKREIFKARKQRRMNMIEKRDFSPLACYAMYPFSKPLISTQRRCLRLESTLFCTKHFCKVKVERNRSSRAEIENLFWFISLAKKLKWWCGKEKNILLFFFVRRFLRGDDNLRALLDLSLCLNSRSLCEKMLYAENMRLNGLWREKNCGVFHAHLLI